MAEENPSEAREETRGDSGQSIHDLIERAFFMGMGAAAYTKDKVQELADEFVRRGQVSSEDGRDMVERLVSRSRDEARAAFKKADSSLQGAYRDLGLMTRRELEDLEFRVRQLEHRVKLLETAADEGSSGGQDAAASRGSF